MKKLIAVTAATLVALLFAGCSPSASQPSASAPAAGGPASSAPAASVPASSASAASGSAAGGATCTYGASGSASKAVNPPQKSGVPNTGTVSVRLSLNGKPIGLTLDEAKAPCTVNSFLSLARQGYFDGISCHRLAAREGFQMLQCGDPTGSGSGGPGYAFDDELTGSETYPAGTLAMANSGPNTNGSQFFLVYGDSPLRPNYTVFGHIDTEGLKTLMALGKGGTDDSEAAGVGKPKLPAVIKSVTVE